MPRTAKPKATFEQSLARLEEIIETVENGEATLEATMDLYKEGLTLSKTCGEILNRFEREIMLLQKESEGVFTQQPFSAS